MAGVPSNVKTLELFISRALETILYNCSRRQTALKDVCKAVLAKIKAAKEVPEDSDMSRLILEYFQPFSMACESSNPKIVIPSLDTLHKLIAYGFIKGDTTYNVDGHKTLIDGVISAIARCYNREQPDEKVNLQIIKALLQAVQSRDAGVHGANLLNSVRVAYEIHLASKDEIIKDSSKASLTQILHTIFDNMEAEAAANPDQSKPQAEASAKSQLEASVSAPADPDSIEDIDVAAWLSPALFEPLAQDAPEPAAGPETETEAETKTEADEDHPSPPSPPSPSIDLGDLCMAMIRGATVTTVAMAVAEFDSKHTLQPDVRPKTETGTDKEETGKEPAEPAEPPALSPESQRWLGSPSQSGSRDPTSGPGLALRDAFRVYKALCKLSIKDSEGDDDHEIGSALPPPEVSLDDESSHKFRSKILSLDLLHDVMEHSGPLFRSHPMFISAIKQYLCVSLLRNGVSTNPAIFLGSLRIFLTLIEYFKVHLKPEIGIFFDNIFLKILESPHSSVQHKYYVLQVLLRICGDPQALVDIFLNYDCDIEGLNIFERIVNVATKIAAAPAPHNPTPRKAMGSGKAINPDSVRTLALNCTIAILNSMLTWARSLEEEDAAQGSDDDIGSGANTPRSVSSTSTNDEFPADAPRPGPSVTPLSRTLARKDSTSVMLVNPALAGSDAIQSVAPEVFQSRKVQKLALMEGIKRFNQKPKKGIAFLVEKGLLEASPPAIYEFMTTTPDVSKTAMGDYMGDADELPMSVLYYYVDQMDFSGMQIDLAIRKFLSGFRLPGEAQKIDRMMEKFAERFVGHNPSVVGSADAAYVLAFAIIMLATDAHSPQIKADRKMKLEGFRKQLRGIDGGQDLDQDMVEAIYRRVVAEPLKLKDDLPESSGAGEKQSPERLYRFFRGGSEAAAGRRAALAHRREGVRLVAQSREMLRARSQSQASAVFYSGSHPSHIRQMFEVVSFNILATLSVVLEQADNISGQKTVIKCLQGFVAAIRIACTFFMETERELFVASLTNFTHLYSTKKGSLALMSGTAGETPRWADGSDGYETDDSPLSLSLVSTIDYKARESTKALLAIAESEGDSLDDSWKPILRVISQLNRLRLIGAGSIEDSEFLRRRQPAARSGPDRGGKNGKQSALPGTRGRGLPGAVKRTSFSIPSPNRLMPRAMALDPGSAASAWASDSEALTEEELAARKERLKLEAAQLMNSLNEKSIDRVFEASRYLSSEAIVAFVRVLTAISLEELNDDVAPRKFLMEKIIEVAHDNMDRVRFVWGQVWSILSTYFSTIGSVSNESVAFFAIDSLRQLAMKFLEREELSHFNFQKAFLAPFNHILEASSSLAAKQLVLDCLTQMYRARAANIRSGWKSLFLAISTVAAASEPRLMTTGFEMLSSLLQNHFKHIVEAFAFVDAVHSLVAYATHAGSTKTALAALDGLTAAVDQLASGVVISPHLADGSPSPDFGPTGSTSSPRSPVTVSEEDLQLKYWTPVLLGLSQVVLQTNPPVRDVAIKKLFGVLTSHGAAFSQALWKTVFAAVIWPIFDDLAASDESMIDLQLSSEISDRTGAGGWLRGAFPEVLSGVVSMFASSYSAVGFLLPDFLKLLTKLINTQHDYVVKHALRALRGLLADAAESLSNDDLELITVHLEGLFADTQASELFEFGSPPKSGHHGPSRPPPPPPAAGTDIVPTPEPSPSPAEGRKSAIRSPGTPISGRSPRRQVAAAGSAGEMFRAVKGKCVVQFRLIEMVENVTSFPKPVFHTSQLLRLLDCIEASDRFAAEFNANGPLRVALWKAGFMPNKPNLIKQETHAVRAAIKILFTLYHHDDSKTPEEHAAHIELASARIPTLTQRAIDTYLAKSASAHPDENKEAVHWFPIMVLILRATMVFDEAQFRAFVPDFYPAFVSLIASENADIRSALVEFFGRVGSIFGVLSRSGSPKSTATPAAAPAPADSGHPAPLTNGPDSPSPPPDQTPVSSPSQVATVLDEGSPDPAAEPEDLAQRSPIPGAVLSHSPFGDGRTKRKGPEAGDLV